MTEDAVIDDILARERGYQDDPRDRGNRNGGATNWGITSQRWGVYRGLGRPATKDEIRAITREEATEFYRGEYVTQSPFAGVAYEPLRVALIDFGINSSEERATRWLQRVLRVEATGKMDERTLTALARYPHFLVHEALIGARMRMILGGVKDGTIDHAMQDGLLRRAVSFSEIKV